VNDEVANDIIPGSQSGDHVTFIRLPVSYHDFLLKQVVVGIALFSCTIIQSLLHLTPCKLLI
jgi:hypothetical protein